MIKIEGRKAADFRLYALSTCIWCRKTKELLEENGVEYSYIFVDMLDGNEKKEIKEELRKWNPDCSYPTLVVDQDKCIIGFDEDKILEEINK